jgi:hypothetical protein
VEAAIPLVTPAVPDPVQPAVPAANDDAAEADAAVQRLI